LPSEFSRIPASALVNVINKSYEGKLYILANVRSPKVISPDRVKIIQEDLSKKLNRPTELIVRTILAKDVSATGSTSQVTVQNLDGFFLARQLPPDILKLQMAEQSLRETLASRPVLTLMDVDMLNFPSGPVIMATIQGPRALIPLEVRQFEKAMQERLRDPKIRLLVRSLITVDVDRKGRILFGAAHFGAEAPNEKVAQEQVEDAVRKEFKRTPEVILTNVDAIQQDGVWQVRVEAVGVRVPDREDVRAWEEAVSRTVQQPVKIFLWSRAEAMVTSQGDSSLEDYTKKRLESHEPP
jgi:hypothetical protein